MKSTQKLPLLLALIMLFATGNSFAQSLQEFFTNKATPLTYLGIDYTKNRLINDPAGNTADIKARLYNSMNRVVLDEMEKNYKIGSAFSRDAAITTDIDAVTERNETINAGDILSSNTSDFNRLKESDIAACVKALNIKAKAGIGLVFIMEAMKKEEKKNYGAVWVTLIDMKTKKVLLTERMEQDAAGLGFRNMWVSVVKKSIAEIDKSAYRKWAKKFGR